MAFYGKKKWMKRRQISFNNSCRVYDDDNYCHPNRVRDGLVYFLWHASQIIENKHFSLSH